MTKREITVLGGAHIDRRGRISGTTVPGASNPGTWFEEAGGGGFNAARNLARLGHRVRMISPRGGDPAGDLVAAAAAAAGVIDCPFIFLDRKTPSYTAILERDGNLVIALADMDLYALFSPRRLRQRATREVLAASDLVLTDANLPQETLTALIDAAAGTNRILAGIAVSPAKVVRYGQSLAGLDLLFMNDAEARVLTGAEAADVEEWPSLLRSAGLAAGVVTRGGKAAVAFDREGACLATPPALPALADVTGAGDALASGFLAARLDGIGLAGCLRHGIAAAVLTLHSPLAAAEEMSADNLARVLTLVPEPQMLS
ncbi:carbohydrate kinase family protein [Sinorhizobium americanum]|uniref:Sugar kinase, ribokinase family n=1 Tax=Sinorhizobium americanum TaxID=194963 RepID=A0A1L3LMQ2_9HYPH|nr:carbohydrate kinase family protein [Sinorhizobium americanum]APG84658.1 sugar kinase, ribokinase family [Sinorhizobium americanum CCGM7]APG91313.1 sugar kinase, ribokinase family [Sinorhizobium americanum]OAP49424.1 carbohydrate kinase [Sinorhizobium americanum]TCN18894.1 sugar/nucleoside kinase (ribokinase family) [Sinorhizobium americanum]